MGMTTVRLDDDDEALLGRLAQVFGGRSNAIRHALRSLADQEARQGALEGVLAAWERTDGPVAELELDEMARRYGL